MLQDEKSATLGTSNDQYVFEDEMDIYDEGTRARLQINDNVSPTIKAHFGTGGGNVPYLIQPTYCLQGNHIDRNAQSNGSGYKEGVSYTLNTQDKHAVVETEQETAALNPYEEFRRHCRVRRFDLTECERLQGMPDGWTQVHFTEEEITPEMIEFFRQIWYGWDKMNAKTPEDAEKVKPRSDKKIIAFLTGEMPDNARYKALGNGIATPQWKWVLKRISAHYERDATMGSLFDGIGSFPYLWEQINGKGSCLWSSEVDPYPIKVTVYRL